MRRSASGDGLIPFSCSFFWIKLSIGDRPDFASSRVIERCDSEEGRGLSDHQSPDLSAEVGNRGSGAPRLTHSSKRAISGAGSFLSGGIW